MGTLVFDRSRRGCSISLLKSLYITGKTTLVEHSLSNDAGCTHLLIEVFGGVLSFLLNKSGELSLIISTFTFAIVNFGLMMSFLGRYCYIWGYCIFFCGFGYWQYSGIELLSIHITITRAFMFLLNNSLLIYLHNNWDRRPAPLTKERAPRSWFSWHFAEISNKDISRAAKFVCEKFIA